MNYALTSAAPAASSEGRYSALIRLFQAYEWVARREMLACGGSAVPDAGNPRCAASLVSGS